MDERLGVVKMSVHFPLIYEFYTNTVKNSRSTLLKGKPIQDIIDEYSRASLVQIISKKGSKYAI